MALCRHKPTGFVTNQDPAQPLDTTRNHASIWTCDRQACVNDALRWVAGETNERSAYYPFGANVTKVVAQ